MNLQPQPFDHYATSYDLHFTQSGIGKAQRALVWQRLKDHLHSKKKILELNCGTGEDAIQLAKLGHNVLATDASSGMMEVAKSKCHAITVPLNLNFTQASFSELNEKVKDENFDLVFSNFGGLNCADEVVLKKLAFDLSALLNSNGKLFMVVMGRSCIWEQLYFLLKAQNIKAFRRKSKSGVNTTVSGTSFKTFYYSPTEITNIFSGNFMLDSLHPVGLFVPPSYLEPFFERNKMLLKFFGFLDKSLHNFSFLADYADHFVIVLKKK